jgi:hypothetical protein
MIDSTLIYGKDWDETKLQDMKYIEALFEKKRSAEKVLEKLFLQQYADNNNLINEVVKAIKFNQVLIDMAQGRKVQE